MRATSRRHPIIDACIELCFPMSESLRDQLLKAGFAPKPVEPPRAKPAARPPQAKPTQRAPQGRAGERPAQKKITERPAPREAPEIDLAKAYALRERTERETRERAQREAEQRAREKKERKQKLGALLGKASLNDVSAEIPRHFPHLNKIRRVYVTEDQLPKLNAGELALVQYMGRYLLVTRETALAAQTIDADALVLLCDAGVLDDDGVPADLTW
jgi:uncharacterized protein YaiL (DUF2058 family)